MKLHQLTIENIASIEHAVIDFNDAPLKDEHLFLISGETGSGKSTIIDCLCLALYGSTPRMKAARGAKYENAHVGSEKKDELSTNNPKQLMRRGSVKASVELTFEDNAGIPYVATWEVHRAHGRVDGRISDVSRCVKTADGVMPAHCYTKIDDIEGHIHEIIGLNMNEFFRTVVLAQGQFAEFLNSDDNEKSNLLEKMTGTEIYTLVSKKIYAVCQEKENKCKILRGQMENITVMEEEQKAKIIDEMGELRRNQVAVDGQLKQATAMAQWLGRKGQIDRQIVEQSRLLEEKQAEVMADAHQAQDVLVKDWEATADARHHLKESDKASVRIAELEREQAGLQEEFDCLCAALRAANNDIAAKQKKADEMGQHLALEATNKGMYDAIGQIVALFNQWREKKQSITDYTADLAKDEKRLPAAVKAVEETKARCEQAQEAVNALKQQQGDYDIAGISARIDDLNHAYRALETLKEKHDAVAQADAAIGELKNNQSVEMSKLEEIKATVGEKRVRKEDCEKQLERVTDWNQLLLQAQKSLHEGDTCPVCGNKITELLAPKAESELEEMRTLLKLADDALQQTLTQIKASEKLILSYENSIDKAGKDLLKKREERVAHWKVTARLLARCGKNADEMADHAAADALIREIEGQVTQLNEQLKKASELTRRLQTAQQQLDEDNRAHHKAEMQCNTIKESIKHQGEVIISTKKEVDDLTAQLDSLLVIDDWQSRADQEFIKQLQAAATAYRELEQSWQQLSQLIEVRRASIPAMIKTRDGIKDLKDNSLTVDQAPDDLEERWRRLGNKHLQWSTHLDTARDQAVVARKALDEYCQTHPDISMERLAALNGHSQAEIDDIKQSHQALSHAVITLKGAVDTLTKQRQELLAQKPDFNEENLERLDELIAQKQEALNVFTTQIADLKAQLNADEEKARLVKDKAELLKQADAEFEQWSQFNKMLGSSDGLKFRRIAQSYILGDLLAKANGYLRQFNNRYELEAKPASLTILVRDLVQGDLTSPTTLSGGESFMVSLALALGLSNMTGRVFSVDTIFIDEGFGSLSEEYLEKVMETLNLLYNMGGRRVGIISHVELLKKRVPTQIQVYHDAENTTVSRIKVVEGVMD